MNDFGYKCVTPQSRALRDYGAAALLIAVMFAVYLVFVPPTPNIPLNDDFGYAQSVRHLLETGELRITDWTSAAIVPQIYWGALFARLAGGFSFVALRWSTIAAAIISCFIFYDLLRQLGLPHATGLLGVLMLLVNPIFINLTYTFMSDITFLALMLLSLTCYARGFQRRSSWWLLGGGLFAALAYLERQLGLLLPVAMTLIWLLRERRWAWRPIGLISVVPALAVIGHQLWLHIVGMPWAMAVFSGSVTVAFITSPASWITIAIRALWSATYLGLFTLPAWVAWLAGRRSLRSTRRLTALFAAWLIVIGLPFAVAIMVNRSSMPQLADIINHTGLGAITSPGSKSSPTADGWFWAITLIAPFVGAAQATLWTEAALHWRRERESFATGLLLTSLLMLLPSVGYVFFWDRYLLVFLPYAAYLVLQRTRLNRVGGFAAIMVSAALMLYTIVGTGDYLAWMTARWNAAEALVAQGIAPESIDAGIEWVGWHELETALPLARAAGKGNELMGWTQMVPKEYLFSFESKSGYRIMSDVTYSYWLSNQPGHIYILRRE